MADHDAPALPPAPALPRPRTAVVGSLFATGAVLMAFFGLVGAYIATRASVIDSGGEWIPEGAIELSPGGMMMTTMVLSAFTIAWAVQALSADDRPHAYIALFLTGLFGASIFNQMWFVYQDAELTIDGGEGQFFFYVLTGAFLIMLIAAMVFVLVTALRALAGQYGPSATDGVWAAAIFWYATIAVYSVLWYVVFITK